MDKGNNKKQGGRKMNLNMVIIGGNLTRDPEMKYVGETPLTSFTVAVNRRFSKEDKTDFFNCVAWDKTGELIKQYFFKGSQIVLTGRLETRKWQNEQGENRYATEIRVDTFEFVDKKSDRGAVQEDFAEVEEDDKDLPF
jgi:single-strand DNA-binding protein